MSVNSIQRGLLAEGNMAIAAGNYQRSTASVVLEVIVGIFTAGTGVLVFEAYHAYNKSQKREEFAGLAGTLLNGLQQMQHEEAGFEILFRDRTIQVRANGNDVRIKFDDEETIVQNKTIGEIRENLKREIISKVDTYGVETAKQALSDETRSQRSLAIEFLQASNIGISMFDHIETPRLVQACNDLIDGHRAADEIEEELNGGRGNNVNVVDEECHELIAAWQRKPPVAQGKVEYVGAVQQPQLVHNRPVQSENEVKVRKLLAEVFLPENSWEADRIEAGELLKSVLIKNSGLLAQIYSNPSLIDDAGLPEELNSIVRDYITDLKVKLNIPECLINQDTVAHALKTLPGESYTKVSQDIDQRLGDFDFNALSGVDMLADLGGMGEGNLQKFMRNVFTKYFDNQLVIDKRAMLASYLSNSGSQDSNEMKLVGLLKGGGPYLQKILQLFGDNAQGELRVALDELKTGLSPINREIVQSTLAGIIDKSGGAITKIDVVRSLGAASVGETLLVRIHWKNEEEPQEAVVKLLRPGIRLRADRELLFFEDEARQIPGMLKTFQGISEQIQVEMDLKKEAANVRSAQVYSTGFENLQAMRLIDKVPPSQGYMVLEKAPGTTVKSAFRDLGQQIKKWRLNNTAPETGAKLASGIKSLTTKWVDEGIFGSGFYHGDMHAGNIMFSDDTGMITAIDMGNSAVMSLAQRRAVFKMVLAAGQGMPDVFVRNYERVLSEEGRQQIVNRRDQLLERTQQIMADVRDPGTRIMQILNAANELGLEIPATVSNFSRSQMMLQNAINTVNEHNTQIRKNLRQEVKQLATKYLEGVQLASEQDAHNRMQEVHDLAKQRLEQFAPDNDLDELERLNKSRIELLVRDARIYLSDELSDVDFSAVIMDVVMNRKWDSAKLAYGDIMAIAFPNQPKQPNGNEVLHPHR